MPKPKVKIPFKGWFPGYTGAPPPGAGGPVYITEAEYQALAPPAPVVEEEVTAGERVEELGDQLGVETGVGVGVGAEVGAEAEEADYMSLFETEYGTAGLGDVKTKIATIDTDITDRKSKRDQAFLTEEGKPIPQWMITGRKKLELDAATADLNRMIDERNAMAREYNTGIAEVERKVNYAIDYREEMTRQLEFEKGYGLEERIVELRETEAAKPTEYAPPTSVKEWEAAGGEAGTGMTLAEWLKAPSPGKAPEDIETYARNLLQGRISEGGVPADIRPMVMRRYNELIETEKTWEDDEIRAWLRSQIEALKAADITVTDPRIEVTLRDVILLDRTLTKIDRERFNLILDETMAGRKPQEAPTEEGKGFWDWFKGGFGGGGRTIA